jgi:hypothetical protein
MSETYLELAAQWDALVRRAETHYLFFPAAETMHIRPSEAEESEFDAPVEIAAALQVATRG